MRVRLAKELVWLFSKWEALVLWNSTCGVICRCVGVLARQRFDIFFWCVNRASLFPIKYNFKMRRYVCYVTEIYCRTTEMIPANHVDGSRHRSAYRMHCRSSEEFIKENIYLRLLYWH
jgi:hypothetical protein